MNVIVSEEDKKLITDKIRVRYPEFKPDVWGMSFIEGGPDRNQNPRILVAGKDTKGRRIFDVLLTPRIDIRSVMSIDEHILIHEEASCFFAPNNRARVNFGLYD